MKCRVEHGTNQVIVQKWEESERGWGERPDGFSLHLSYGALKKYIEEYWDCMPDSVPDEYSRPCGTPYLAGVSDAVLERLNNAGLGLRYHSGYEYPGSGGIDGWMPMQS